MANYTSLYDSHLYTNPPFLNDAFLGNAYWNISNELSTNPFEHPQSQQGSYNFSSYVPVFEMTVPSNSVIYDAEQPFLDESTSIKTAFFQAQHIREDVKKSDSKIKRIDIIDFIATITLITLVGVIMSLAVLINPCIAFGLIGLAMATPLYISISLYTRQKMEGEPETTPLKYIDYSLSTNQSAFRIEDPTQTLVPQYTTYR